MNVTQFNTIIVNGYTPTTFSSAVAGKSFILNQSPNKEELEDTLVLPPSAILGEVSIQSVTPVNQVEEDGRWGLDLNRVYPDDSTESVAYHVPLEWVNSGVALFGVPDHIGRIGTTKRSGGHGILFDNDSSIINITTVNSDLNGGSVKVTLTLHQLN